MSWWRIKTHWLVVVFGGLLGYKAVEFVYAAQWVAAFLAVYVIFCVVMIEILHHELRESDKLLGEMMEFEKEMFDAMKRAQQSKQMRGPSGARLN